MDTIHWYTFVCIIRYKIRVSLFIQVPHPNEIQYIIIVLLSYDDINMILLQINTFVINNTFVSC